MRHRVAGRHLGRDTAHRLSLYRNLVTDLLKYERITTTEAKAKEIRPMAERIITLGRRGDLHARRQAMKFVFDPGVVKKVFDDLGQRAAQDVHAGLAYQRARVEVIDVIAVEEVELVGEAAPGDLLVGEVAPWSGRAIRCIDVRQRGGSATMDTVIGATLEVAS